MNRDGNAPLHGADGMKKLVWVSILLTLPLLILGTLVTTLKVGMVDPLWPTEPWYLLNDPSRPDSIPFWKEDRTGYLLEHIHRVFGYLVGFAVLIQTIAFGHKSRSMGVWIFGIAAVLVGTVLAMTSIDRTLALSDPIGAVQPGILRAGLGIILAGMGALFVTLVVEYREKGSRRFVMSLGALVFLGVISQGLLGGLRVYLNAVGGTQLACIHGALAQVVFAGIIGLLALITLEKNPPSALPTPKARRGVIIWTHGLLMLCLLQLAWAVWLRHFHHPVAQRLHLFFGCLIPAFIVGIHLKGLQFREIFRWFGPASGMLFILVLFQVLLGIEAWIGKFGTGKPLIEAAVNFGQIGIRTTHTLLGAFVLAGSLVLAMRASFIPLQPSLDPNTPQAGG